MLLKCLRMPHYVKFILRGFAAIHHNQTTKPSMTPISPNPIPATSLPPAAVPLPVDNADGEAGDAAVTDAVAAASNVWPRLGSLALPLTFQPSLVDVGHGGGDRLAVDWV